MLDQRKPFKGYIKNWRIHSMLKGHVRWVEGIFVDHPNEDFQGKYGHTSAIVNEIKPENVTEYMEVETLNSMYRLRYDQEDQGDVGSIQES